MGILGTLGIILIAVAVTRMWVSGIDYMKDNHPDYKGEDFLSEDKEDKKK